MLPLSVLIQPDSGLGAGGGTIVNPTSSTTDPSFVTFKKASYGQAAHGGPVPAYPASVTLAATVAVSGTARRVSTTNPATSEARPIAHMTFKVVTREDPAVYLGAPLNTDDRMDWAGFNLLVVGTAFPTAKAFETIGELTL